MKRTLVIAAVSLSLTSLTGCGMKTREGAATRPVAAHSSAASSGSAMTIEKAAATYLKLIEAPNATREAWMSAPSPTPANLAKHKKLAARASDATVAFVKGLRGHRWPGEAQPIVDALVVHLQKREAAYRKVLKARTVAEYLAAAGQVPVTTSLSSDLRAVLGLPEGAVVTGATPR